MPVKWERIPDGVPEDFQALDGDEIVGRVYQIPTRPERGLWFWTMTASVQARASRSRRVGRRLAAAMPAGAWSRRMSGSSPVRRGDGIKDHLSMRLPVLQSVLEQPEHPIERGR